VERSAKKVQGTVVRDTHGATESSRRSSHMKAIQQVMQWAAVVGSPLELTAP
jgi:hypothetical protein